MQNIDIVIKSPRDSGNTIFETNLSPTWAKELVYLTELALFIFCIVSLILLVAGSIIGLSERRAWIKENSEILDGIFAELELTKREVDFHHFFILFFKLYFINPSL